MNTGFIQIVGPLTANQNILEEYTTEGMVTKIGIQSQVGHKFQYYSQVSGESCELMVNNQGLLYLDNIQTKTLIPLQDEGQKTKIDVLLEFDTNTLNNNKNFKKEGEYQPWQKIQKLIN